MARVLVAMSGGVDSSVAAYLLARQGHDVAGATMLLHASPGAPRDRALADIEDARAVARRLGIDHMVLDCAAQFEAAVVDGFAASYEAGLTPNPCVVCNRRVKFGLLLDRAHDLGFDLLATGHYARIGQAADGSGGLMLRKAADRAKDQSYFLCLLGQRQLAGTLLPLGGMAKDEVRAVAEEQGFPCASKSESQDICFVPVGNYLEFLERRRGGPYPSGDILHVDGTVVGRHRGVAGCTIGQHKGLGVALGAPVYVCAKDAKANTVTVGPLSAVMASGCLAERWNWVGGQAPGRPVRVRVRTHYRHVEQPATVVPLADGAARVEFDEPQKAIAPGQFAVAYDGDEVLGGGAIAQVLR